MNPDALQALERGNVRSPAVAFVCCNRRNFGASRRAHGSAAKWLHPICMNLAGE